MSQRMCRQEEQAWRTEGSLEERGLPVFLCVSGEHFSRVGWDSTVRSALKVCIGGF